MARNYYESDLNHTDKPVLLFEGSHPPSNEIVRVVVTCDSAIYAHGPHTAMLSVERRQRWRAMGEPGWEPYPLGTELERRIELDIKLAVLAQLLCGFMKKQDAEAQPEQPAES